MNAREQLLQRQRAVLEEALLREIVMREWCESVACAFAFDLAIEAEPGPTPMAYINDAAARFSEALAVARGVKV